MIKTFIDKLLGKRAGSKNPFGKRQEVPESVHHIDPALVGSRNEVALLVQEGAAARPEDHALLRGWRAELLGGEPASLPA